MAAIHKKAAAVSAVVYYIKTQEEAMSGAMRPAQDAPDEKMQRPAAPAMGINYWGISGRQQHMQLRTLMQLKAFHGFMKS